MSQDDEVTEAEVIAKAEELVAAGLVERNVRDGEVFYRATEAGKLFAKSQGIDLEAETLAETTAALKKLEGLGLIRVKPGSDPNDPVYEKTELAPYADEAIRQIKRDRSKGKKRMDA